MAQSEFLDPKADLTFKKVFGNHPDLLISLLNALLPLSDDQQIESVEYLPTELVPVTPLRKNTIVDVRCKDIKGRQFVVEMQMEWTNAFMNRVLFNASKAYVSQAEEGFCYEDLMPVYSLCLINDTFDHDTPRSIHNYAIVCDTDTRKVIEGLHFTFIELPKYEPHTMGEKRMAVLWLRFLTEIGRKTVEVPSELLEEPAIRKAINEVRKSAFSEKDILSYDEFWDAVSTERTLMEERYRKGLAEGIAEGHAKGMEEGHAKGMEEGIIATAKKMKALGLPAATIAAATGLSEEQVEVL